MSEYQYYEFASVDRPLTKKEMAQLRRITSRAEITPYGLKNEYHWGDFSGDPVKLMQRYFDAHLYFANWRAHRLMIRVPIDRVDVDAIQQYFARDTARSWVADGRIILDIGPDDESNWDGFEDEWSLAPLLPLRAELMRGDMRPAYLAWLDSVLESCAEEDEQEPPVPPGLADLTTAQRAMVGEGDREGFDEAFAALKKRQNRRRGFFDRWKRAARVEPESE